MSNININNLNRLRMLRRLCFNMQTLKSIVIHTMIHKRPERKSL
jgi:hypothetical protein